MRKDLSEAEELMVLQPNSRTLCLRCCMLCLRNKKRPSGQGRRGRWEQMKAEVSSARSTVGISF